MKTLYVKEEQVEELVSVPEVIDILEAAFRIDAGAAAFARVRVLA